MLQQKFIIIDMTKEDAINEINTLQNEYVDKLIDMIKSPKYDHMKAINFTSATGTGKTKMMSILINKLPEFYYVVTTLSKGQLHLQVRENLQKECRESSFIVYGSADYRINSRLDAQDIIEKIPKDVRCIWLRDEGHIKTNRWDEILLSACYKVINFSATNAYNDVLCNFTQTMMLRTVNQTTGTPEDAIQKLIEVKKAHKNVSNYNPCAIFRCVNEYGIERRIKQMCKKNNLKCIDISEDSYIMSELCEDDNEYDVIINKLKIQEGIDIRRAHVLFMDNQPKNTVTTIQAIGRCRRNALFYRDDIDILAPENEELLNETRECYVFYNVTDMWVETDETGELFFPLCNHISCEALKADTTISVVNGQLPNGLYIVELEGQTGEYKIVTDEKTGFNIVEPLTDFYNIEEKIIQSYIYTYHSKILSTNIHKLPICSSTPYDNSELINQGWSEGEYYYHIQKTTYTENVNLNRIEYDPIEAMNAFSLCKNKYNYERLIARYHDLDNVVFLDEYTEQRHKAVSSSFAHKAVTKYIN